MKMMMMMLMLLLLRFSRFRFISLAVSVSLSPFCYAIPNNSCIWSTYAFIPCTSKEHHCFRVCSIAVLLLLMLLLLHSVCIQVCLCLCMWVHHVEKNTKENILSSLHSIHSRTYTSAHEHMHIRARACERTTTKYKHI